MSTLGLEKILTRIGMGKFHKVLFVTFGLMYISYGMNLTLSTIMPIVLKDVWRLSNEDLGIYGGIFNLGLSMGTLLAAWEDTFGRKIFLRLGIIAIFVGSAGSAFMPDFWSFSVFRFIVGLGVGLFEIAEVSLIAEINAIPYRAKFFVLLNITFLIGSVGIIGLCFVMTPGFNPDHWRYLIAISAAFAVPPLIMTWIFITESPRFLISQKRNDEAAAVFEQISIYSNKGPLSEDELTAIQNARVNHELGFCKSIKEIYTTYLRITLQLNQLWFGLGIIQYGVLYLAPLELVETSNYPLLFELIITSAQFLDIFLSSIGIENPKFGRKKNLI